MASWSNLTFTSTHADANLARTDLFNQAKDWYLSFVPSYLEVTQSGNFFLIGRSDYMGLIKLESFTSGSYCFSIYMTSQKGGKYHQNISFTMSKVGANYQMTIPYIACRENNTACITIIGTYVPEANSMATIFTDNDEVFCCCRGINTSSTSFWWNLRDNPSATNLLPGTSLPSPRENECMMMPSVYRNKIFPEIKHFRCNPSVGGYTENVVFGGKTYNVLYNGVCMLKA